MVGEGDKRGRINLFLGRDSIHIDKRLEGFDDSAILQLGRRLDSLPHLLWLIHDGRGIVKLIHRLLKTLQIGIADPASQVIGFLRMRRKFPHVEQLISIIDDRRDLTHDGKIRFNIVFLTGFEFKLALL